MILLLLHNLLRWGVLIFGLWTVINAVTGVISKRPYTAGDNKSNLLFMIFCDIQLLLGIALYITNGWYNKFKDMSAVMKNSNERFFTVEHAGMMLLAWILVHVGRASVNKAASASAKHKKMLIFFGLALILILASIPWPFRAEVARPLTRWIN